MKDLFEIYLDKKYSFGLKAFTFVYMSALPHSKPLNSLSVKKTFSESVNLSLTFQHLPSVPCLVLLLARLVGILRSKVTADMAFFISCNIFLTFRELKALGLLLYFRGVCLPCFAFITL